jgi:hypothetical protein
VAKIQVPNRKIKVQKAFTSDRRRANDLRIGDRWGDGKVKALHELCPLRPGPHVHVIPNGDGGSPRCFDFNAFV